MNISKLIFSYISIMLILNGCSYKINSSIQKSESLITRSSDLKSIYYLQPRVSIFRLDGFRKEDYSLITTSTNEISRTINKLTRKFKIQNNNLTLNKVTDSLSSLNDLSQRIINTNQIQQNIFNQISREDETKLVQQVFTIEPNIGYDYSSLEPVIKSQLVGLVGVIAIDLKGNYDLLEKIPYSVYLPRNGYIQYHYIVNIITGKIIYRDIRLFDSKLKKEHLMITLYDTFYLLNKNLKP